jgi:hypothetical protein
LSLINQTNARVGSNDTAEEEDNTAYVKNLEKIDEKITGMHGSIKELYEVLENTEKSIANIMEENELLKKQNELDGAKISQRILSSRENHTDASFEDKERHLSSIEETHEEEERKTSSFKVKR